MMRRDTDVDYTRTLGRQTNGSTLTSYDRKLERRATASAWSTSGRRKTACWIR
ncbi:hypothetical protein V6L77_00335 [Pannonibacter sp. Pt2-lr]